MFNHPRFIINQHWLSWPIVARYVLDIAHMYENIGHTHEISPWHRENDDMNEQFMENQHEKPMDFMELMMKLE